MKLAELKSDIREKRREIEWKVSIGIWAITAAATTYLRGYSVVWSLIFLALLVAAHAWLWVRTNYNSSQRDSEVIYFFMDHAARIVLPESVPDPGDKQPVFSNERKKWEFLKHEPIWFEVAATILLGLAVVILSRTTLITKAN